ncbi:MAG: hypothetical protein R8K20_00745 [Gallionellaceae bacterium]
MKKIQNNSSESDTEWLTNANLLSESDAVIEKIARALGRDIARLMGEAPVTDG